MFRTGCRIHGAGCRVPWGYDEAHTDSSRPYTLDELAERPDAPHRYAYPTVRDYERGFYLWRALQVDARLTRAERDAQDSVLLARMGINAGNVEEALEQLRTKWPA